MKHIDFTSKREGNVVLVKVNGISPLALAIFNGTDDRSSIFKNKRITFQRYHGCKTHVCLTNRENHINVVMSDSRGTNYGVIVFELVKEAEQYIKEVQQAFQDFEDYCERMITTHPKFKYF